MSFFSSPRAPPPPPPLGRFVFVIRINSRALLIKIRITWYAVHLLISRGYRGCLVLPCLVTIDHIYKWRPRSVYVLCKVKELLNKRSSEREVKDRITYFRALATTTTPPTRRRTEQEQHDHDNGGSSSIIFFLYGHINIPPPFRSFHLLLVSSHPPICDPIPMANKQ